MQDSSEISSTGKQSCVDLDIKECKAKAYNATKKDIDTILDIADLMNGKTICVFAPAVSAVLVSHIKKFPDEFYSLVK